MPTFYEFDRGPNPRDVVVRFRCGDGTLHRAKTVLVPACRGALVQGPMPCGAMYAEFVPAYFHPANQWRRTDSRWYPSDTPRWNHILFVARVSHDRLRALVLELQLSLSGV